MKYDDEKQLQTNVENTKGLLYEKPDCDIMENDSDYTILFDIPGADKDSIDLKVEKDILTMTASCSQEVDSDFRCVHSEMGYNGYKRSFDLNNTADPDKIEANYENGTLRIKLPKREEQKTKEIKISVN